jgi:hypothetical protein
MANRWIEDSFEDPYRMAMQLQLFYIKYREIDSKWNSIYMSTLIYDYGYISI